MTARIGVSLAVVAAQRFGLGHVVWPHTLPIEPCARCAHEVCTNEVIDSPLLGFYVGAGAIVCAECAALIAAEHRRAVRAAEPVPDVIPAARA